MSEDSGLTPLHSVNEPQMNADKRRYGLDLSDSLGQGMLASEALRNAPGLSPLHLDNELQKAPQRTLRTQSSILTDFAVFAPFAVRVTKEREMNDR